MHTKPLRPAIAMIELIFALVIMGITLMSAPMLLNQSINSSTTALQQESIAATAAQISLVLTYAWDESQTDNGFIAITIDNVDNVDLRVVNRAVGGMARGFTPLNPALTTANPIANFGFDVDVDDAGRFNDIDDFNAQVSNINIYAGEATSFALNEGDYIDTNVNIATIVTYAGDAPAAGIYAGDPINFNNPFANAAPGGRTHIKLINVTLTSNRPGTPEMASKNISLSAFVCNIGNLPDNTRTIN